MTTVSPKGTALITGASSGIGAVYADRLAKAGYNLILVARSADRLRDAASRLTRETGRTVETLAADLTKAADLAKVETVLKTDSSITLLVNNAGVGAVGPLLASNVGKMDDMITLNVTALTHLALAAATAFVARGTGTIVNISSIAAFAPQFLHGIYNGTKSFVLVFSQGLHQELADKGVRIQAVLPGATATDFWPTAGVSVANLPESIVMSAEDVVDAALAGLALGEIVTIPSLPEQADWEALEKARNALMPNLSRSVPAKRYKA
jgi:short-subunit dehydrogenase